MSGVTDEDNAAFANGTPDFGLSRRFGLRGQLAYSLNRAPIWDWLLHAEGIADDVRNATVANWDEARLFDCLSWLYDGAPMPTKLANEKVEAHT